MNLSSSILRSDEAAVYRLRALYEKYGYSRYKVSKFEKYDLYARNKSFLVCENILTFTDTTGALMALKPDVTLSIVKNFGVGAEGTGKLYYSETVYRTGNRSEGFREIRQTGLECIGRIDTYLTGEVVMLAQKSLREMGDRYVLDVSHMGFLLGLLRAWGIPMGDTDEVLSYMANKNLPALTAFLAAKGLGDARDAICGITTMYEPLETALPKLRAFVRGDEMEAAYGELKALSEVMNAWACDEPLYVDFSIAGDRNYYNGIIFRGYLSGTPEAVLSGGRYDSLLSRMGRQGEAIGFAVYPDRIGYTEDRPPYDVDAVLLYAESDRPADVIAAVRGLETEGRSVRAECGDRTDTRCRFLYRLKGREAEQISAPV